MLEHNHALATDSYKVTHHLQYPPGTQRVYSYFEARSNGPVMFFGLQYIIDEFLRRKVTQGDVDYAAMRWAAHFGTDKLFNRAGWEHIVNVHGGYLPLSIRAVPEGLVLPHGNVLMTVENTDPKVPWLTNWMETLISQAWYPSTVATRSWRMRQLIAAFLEETGTPGLINFKLHDFGYRGSTSQESAGIGGMAHLVNFMGTDTAQALEYATRYYGADMAGFSIPAAEHSTITSWGKDREVDAYRNMIIQFGDGQLYAVVADSYDVIHACLEHFRTTLKPEILNANGTIVIRPDSGTPHEIVPRVIKCLAEKFGVEENAKGYWVLPPKVRVIQGDGITYEETKLILERMRDQRWSADNVAFGMGAGLLQKVDRDTHSFAFKCSRIEGVNPDGTEWGHDVSKNPATDSGKASKPGRLRLIKEATHLPGNEVPIQTRYRTVRANEWVEGPDELVEVYRDGRMLVQYSFEEVRQRALQVSHL